MSDTTMNPGGFGAILARSWIWGRRALWFGAAALVFVIALEAIHLHELVSRVHPALAWVVTVLVTGLFVGWPVWVFARYLRMPRVITPPKLPPPAEQPWDERQRRAYRRFAVAFLRRQLDNPNLPEDAKARIPATIRTIEQPETDGVRLEKTVMQGIDEILQPLDVQARRLIRRASVDVALATAISPSILLDSLITLNRNLELIAKLATLYYGRPGLGGTLLISRDVLGSAVAAGALEIVSDHLSSALTEMAGSWSSRLVGPLGQGMVNGVVTMRFGAATQMRCRSLRRQRVPWMRWGIGDYRRAFSGLGRWITEEVGPSVMGPLDRALVWTGKAAETTIRGGAGVWNKVRNGLGIAQVSEVEPEPGAVEPTRSRKDPVFDGGLLD